MQKQAEERKGDKGRRRNGRRKGQIVGILDNNNLLRLLFSLSLSLAHSGDNTYYRGESKEGLNRGGRGQALRQKNLGNNSLRVEEEEERE